MKNKVLTILLILTLTNCVLSNDTLRINNISIGVKIALPNFILGLSGEYNGFYNNRISIISNISYIPSIKINKSLDFASQNYSIGLSYHFLQNRNAFIDLGIGYAKTQYTDNNTVTFYDEEMNKVNANLIYTARFIYFKPSVGYYFRIKKLYIKPEIEYYLTNYNYSIDNWKYHLENGAIKNGNELFPVNFENLTICLTVGYLINLN